MALWLSGHLLVGVYRVDNLFIRDGFDVEKRGEKRSRNR
jgi:hypothetical protein